MIENDDFSIKEDITGTPDELKDLFTKGTSKTIKALSLGNVAADNMDSIYNNWLGGGVSVRSSGSNSNPEDIPTKDRPIVYKILKVLQSKNLLPNDLTSQFKPKHGFFRDNTNKSLILFKSQSIKLLYNDDKLTTLEKMVIIKNKNTSSSDFKDLKDELEKDKNKLKINNIQLITNIVNSDIITIEF